MVGKKSLFVLFIYLYIYLLFLPNTDVLTTWVLISVPNIGVL